MIQRKTVRAGGVSLTNAPFVGPVDHTSTVRVDLSGLTSAEVDSDGILKPGVPLTKAGTLVSRRPGLHQAVVTGGAAGALTATGIKSTDRLISVVNLADGDDLTDETTITDDDEITTASTDTTGDKLLVSYSVDDQYVFGVTIGAQVLADGNTQTHLDNAGNVDVAVARIALAQRAIVEKNLGRTLTANEVLAFAAPGSKVALVE